MSFSGLGPITHEDALEQQERDEYWDNKREEGTIGTETINNAINTVKALGKQVWDPSEQTKQKISGGLKATGQILGESWQETREFGEWHEVPKNLGAIGARGIEATGAVVSNVVGKPVAATVRKFGFDPRIAGAVALAAELGATAGTAKAGQIAKARVGQYVDDAYGLFSATGMGTGAHGAGKVTKTLPWREGYKQIPKGRDLLDDAADYALPDQVQSLNKYRRIVKAEENAKLAELRKAGIIKEAPDYNLKSSAEATKYYGLDTKQLKKYNLKYDQRGSSKNPKFELGLTEPRAIDRIKREISEEMLTPNKAVFKAGKAKWKEINEKLGMEAHHIIPIHVSAKVMLNFLYDKFGNLKRGGMAKWKARMADDAKKGIFHGNDRRNIVAARGSTKEPLTEAARKSEIYHRMGKPDMDNAGYHALEKLISGIGLDEGGIPLYHQLRDIMRKQVELRHKGDKIIMDVQGKPRKLTTAPKK